MRNENSACGGVILPPVGVACKPLSGNALKHMFISFGLESDCRFFLHNGVKPLFDQCLYPVTFSPGRFQRDFWIHPNRVHLPGTAQPLTIPPELGTIGLHTQKEAAAIPKLVHLGSWLRRFHFAGREKIEYGECHVCTKISESNVTPISQ